MTGRRAPRGFTLIELMLALSLIVVLLFMGISSVRSSAPSKAATLGLAEEVGEELRRARQRAKAEQQPVGVAFPSASNTTPLSRGLYNLVGAENPRVGDSLRFDAEYGDSVIFTGTWGIPDTTAPALGANLADFDFPTWLGANTDHVILFLPSGVVLSNLPSFEGRYGLVSSSNFEFSSGWPNRLTETQQAQTIWVSAVGTVSIEPGPPAGVALTARASTASAAPPPGLTTAGPDAPVFVTIKPEPPYEFGYYDHINANLTGTVRREEYATFIVQATDPNGGPLVSSWTGPGSFSSATDGRMEWDQSAGHWQVEWTWTPPQGADPPETIYDLVCEIRDPEGNVTLSDASISPKMALSSQGVVVVDNNSRFILNEEGHVIEEIPKIDPTPVPIELQRDGTTLIVEADYGVIKQVRIDGTELPGTVTGEEPALSSDGTTMVYITGVPLNYRISWSNLDGTSRASYRPFAANVFAQPAMFGSSAADYAIVAEGHLGLVYFRPSNPSATEFSIPSARFPQFSSDGLWISFYRSGGLYVVGNPPYTGSGASKVAKPVSLMTAPTPSYITRGAHAWSPDSSQILFFRHSATGDELSLGRVRGPTPRLPVADVRPLSTYPFSGPGGVSWIKP